MQNLDELLPAMGRTGSINRVLQPADIQLVQRQLGEDIADVLYASDGTYTNIPGDSGSVYASTSAVAAGHGEHVI